MILFTALSFLNLGYAGNWDVTTQSFPVKSLLGPTDPSGYTFKEQIGYCFVGIEPGCLASDGGLTWASSWSLGTCNSTYDSGSGLVSIYLTFNTGVDANGFTVWPTSWPSTVACTRTIPTGPEAGKVHTLRVNVTSGDQHIRYKTSDFSTTQMSLGTGKSLVVESAFDVKEFVINIPDGSYTGNIDTNASKLYTAATGGSAIDHAYCLVLEGGDDYLWVGLDDSITTDLNGGSPGRGTFYCRVTAGGVTVAIPLSVTIN